MGSRKIRDKQRDLMMDTPDLNIIPERKIFGVNRYSSKSLINSLIKKIKDGKLLRTEIDGEVVYIPSSNHIEDSESFKDVISQKKFNILKTNTKDNIWGLYDSFLESNFQPKTNLLSFWDWFYKKFEICIENICEDFEDISNITLKGERKKKIIEKYPKIGTTKKHKNQVPYNKPRIRTPTKQLVSELYSFLRGKNQKISPAFNSGKFPILLRRETYNFLPEQLKIHVKVLEFRNKLKIIDY